MPNTLFFDTETTGMLQWKLPAHDPSQPKIVQLAAILRNDDTKRELSSINLIVEPEDWEVSAGAAGVHGITTEFAREHGVAHSTSVEMFLELLDRAETVVAHNIRFDAAVMRTAFYIHAEHDAEKVAQYLSVLDQRRPRCTMLQATNIVKVLHNNPKHPADYKWPKLEECVRYFFNEKLDGAHDALVDVRACIRVYDQLCAMGAFDKAPVRS